MSVPVDHLQRLHARDPKSSWCVTAPAGAGKTELLTQRVLALLAEVREPEEILAITFTRKAAAEMQRRIVSALALAEAPEPVDAHLLTTWRLARQVLERDRAAGWALRHNPARLRILTIDGLCAALTRQMPVVTAFGGAPEPVEDPEPLYRQAVAGLLDVLESDEPAAAALQRLLAHLDNHWGRAENLLVSLLGKRDQWLRHLGIGLVSAATRSEAEQTLRTVRQRLDATLQEIHQDVLQRVRMALGSHAQWVLRLAHRCAEALAADRASIDQATPALLRLLECPAPGWEAADSEVWIGIADWLLTRAGGWRQRWDKRQGAIDRDLRQELADLTATLAEQEDGLAALTALRGLPASRYSDAQWQLLSTLAEVLPRLVQELYWVFQRYGVADFTEVALAALTALGDENQPGDALLALDGQLQHVLIDEFQDTSATQWRLLHRLLEGWAEHNAAQGPPRTLFIVGDGMQSIYGFREADVGLFLTARTEGVNGVSLQEAPLRVNFRSTPAVVEWINRHFSQAFPGKADIHRGAVPFAPAVAFQPLSADSEVRVYGCLDDPRRQQETATTIALIQRSLQETSGEIAVLVRNRSHLDRLIPALDRADIAWRASDIDPLGHRAAVQDLLSLCRALLNPADRISWLALLRSPLAGLDNSDLHALLAGADGEGRRLPVWQRITDMELRAQLSIGGRQRLARLQQCLGVALAQRSRQPLAQWLKGCWLALGGGAIARMEGQLEDTERVFELLDDISHAEIDAEALSRAVTRLFAGAGDSTARVQLMTMHRAKGLEFETVILPGLDRVPRSDDRALLLWSLYRSETGAEGLVLAGAPAQGKEDPTYEWLNALRRERQSLEATRLLYVGATRAERRLYLLFCLDSDDAGEPRPPAKSSLLSCLWSTLREEVQWSSESGMDQALAASAPAPRQLDWTDTLFEPRPLQVLATDWQPPPWPVSPRYQWAHGPQGSTRSSRLDVSPGLHGLREDVPAPRPETAFTGDAAAAGRALHWLLEQLAARGETFWTRRSASVRQHLLDTLLLQEGLPRRQLEEERERLTLALQQMLRDPRGRWLLFGNHRETWQELDLLHAEGRAIIDRCFVSADRQQWIVDYKLVAPAPGEALRKFAERQVEQYGAQLERYAQRFAKPVRTALYFPLVPMWVELEEGRIISPDHEFAAVILDEEAD